MKKKVYGRKLTPDEVRLLIALGQSDENGFSVTHHSPGEDYVLMSGATNEVLTRALDNGTELNILLIEEVDDCYES